MAIIGLKLYTGGLHTLLSTVGQREVFFSIRNIFKGTIFV